MHGVMFCFSMLLVHLVASNLASSKSSSEPIPSIISSFQAVRDKIETKCPQASETSVATTVSMVATQLMLISNRLTTVETQLRVELQTTKEGLQTTKDELQTTKDGLQTTKDELQTTKDELQTTKEGLETAKSYQQITKEKLQNTTADLEVTKAEVALLRSGESNPGSSSFVHWGRTSCPGNTTLVYSGVAGGKHYQHKGSGTNRLCLSRQPEFDDNINPSSAGYLYGAEYKEILGLHDNDVPCSVCLAPQASTIMIPGTRTCPLSWTRQYHGHLASHYYEHFASEFVCLDEESEHDVSGAASQKGNLFYYTKTDCGSLPCPPYIDNKVVTCVVCSQ